MSVVIPVYDDADALVLCLECLARQTYPADRHEIVVVDNGSSFDPARVTAGQPGVTLIRCPKPGSYAARNRGVAAARGTVIAFTDADCRPREDWLEAGVAALARDPTIAVLGGHIQIVGSRQAIITAAELHQHVSAFPQRRYLERANFLATANVFTYKSVFERVGPFEERLYSTGDYEWGQRAHARGFRLGFCPDVVTAHPARATLASLLGKSVRIAGGHFALRRLRGQSHVAAMVEYLRRALRSTLGKGPHTHLPWRDRVRFVAVEWAIAAARLVETLRLLGGGSPRRR